MPDDVAAILETSRDCLRRWAPFSEAYWSPMPDRPGLGCFGTGYGSWGVQTNQKYVAAMGSIAASRAGELPGFSRQRARERFLAALRFSLASHHTGDYRLTDGNRWGRTWISALGVERMMHAVDSMDAALSDADRDALRAMLTDEADHQLTVPVVAGKWGKSGRNKPESNIWNGAICARAALYYPDHPHAADWTERAHLYFLNGISVPADAEDSTIVEGRPLRDRHAGANFFPHYALDHHGYLNAGYMVICLSNIAMIHYAFVLRGKDPPATLYHHAKDLWGLVKRLVFADGRLIRIGGDTRVRYCYCQDYLIPTLVFAADHWGDPHALALLRGAVDLVRQEQGSGGPPASARDVRQAHDPRVLSPRRGGQASKFTCRGGAARAGDGRFLSKRLAHIERASPYYYTRLESDKAAVLSMALDWLGRRKIETPRQTENRVRLQAGFEASVAGNWAEPEHGAVFHRSPTRFASFSWRAAEPPQGLCLPPSDGHLAEWHENLGGGLRALGAGGGRKLISCDIASFEGGFLTAGEVADGTDVEFQEGWRAEESARRRIVFAALPDGHSVVRLERVTLPARRVYLAGWAGVKLEVPNDLFNGNVRRYSCAGGVVELASHEGERTVVDLESSWVNVEDAVGLVGIYGADSWKVLRRGGRIGGRSDICRSILTDALCYGLREEPSDVYGPAVMLDNACLVLASVGAEETRALSEIDAAKRLACATVGAEGDAEPCRAVLAEGRDGRSYLVAANLGDAEATVEVGAPAGTWSDLAGEGSPLAGPRLPLVLSAGEARLLVLDRES